ncbi:hypothetical protein [Streptomyces sp. t39]|uniref:hypothetical protein n=1 Tax=Streptomyces sp. t39 TaxID=1828156 RepID=UPI0011CD42B2|nr:hypothetical protein [Streptomyces sp. t39]
MLPIGFAANVWGNELYSESRHWAGLALFFGGLALAVRGAKSWRGISNGWQTPKRIRLWASLKWDSGWKKYWESAKLTVWAIIVLGLLLYGWKVLGGILNQPDGITVHFPHTLSMMLAWGLLPFVAQWAEPNDPPRAVLLKLLGSKIWRAVITRTVANCAGFYFAGLSVYTLTFTSRPTFLVPVVVTLGVAAIATGHKTWTRLRKLSTQLYGNVQELKRDLAAIPGNTGNIEDRLNSARRSWDLVSLDLWTNVDTGYGLLGTPFLPGDIVAELALAMEESIVALEHDKNAAKDVLIFLDAIQEACFARIDSVA